MKFAVTDHARKVHVGVGYSKVTWHSTTASIGIDEVNFDPNREHPFSKDMRSIFDAFGIPAREYNAIAYANRSNSKNNDLRKPESKFIPVQFYDIPDHFYPLQDAPLTNVITNGPEEIA